MNVTICSFDELPDWVDRDELPNNGPGKDCASYLVIDDGGYRAVYSSAMEPEDVQFYRNLKWVKAELERVAEDKNRESQLLLTTTIEQRDRFKLALDAEIEIRSRLHDVLEKAGAKITELSAMVRALSEPQRLCGGCGFLIGVSRLCLTEGCGNDYSNDPKAFAALEIDRP